jgi:predicted amino acid dehydrogenase
MSRPILVSIALIAAALCSGCSLTAPKYSPSLENVQLLKDSGAQTTSVGAFQSTLEKKKDASISVRGNSLASPYDGSYASYLA